MRDSSLNAYDVAVRFTRINPPPLSRIYEEALISGEVVSPPYILRADGVGFGKSLRSISKLIRDWRIHESLLRAAKVLMMRIASPAAYVVSDEVNVLVTNPIYGGRVFKIVSVSASVISSIVSLFLNKPLGFDCRIIKLRSQAGFIPYTIFRARVGVNNFISKLYHESRPGPETPGIREMIREVSDELRRWRSWACAGTLLIKSPIIKKGVNPLTGEEVMVSRYVIKEFHIESPAQVAGLLTRAFRSAEAK